jgi:hypothetical protein
VAETTAAAVLNLGFLTVLHEASGYLGGYLVTNVWGRPLEFRLSTAVQPNRVQQILYGDTLQPYICADLIGKTLVEKTATAIRLLVTDREPVLQLRPRLEVPVAWMAPATETVKDRCLVRPAAGNAGPVFCHPAQPADATTIRELLGRLDTTLDLEEPFARIRDAIGEARKVGIASRN